MFNNWAFFGNAKSGEPLWTFGNFEKEDIEEITLGFLKGLHNLGKELFDKGIASFKLIPSKSTATSSFWGDELFIINLEGSFFLVISDPQTTIKMIASENVKIPNEIDEQIRSVLVGQASIQYANMCSDIESEKRKPIDQLFQTALNEVLSVDEQKISNVFVENGSCSFSGLDSTQILIFHYLLRQHFIHLYRKGIYASFINKPWAILQNITGAPIPLIYNSPKNAVLLSAFLSLVNSYTKATFNSKLQSLVFGDADLITAIDIVHSAGEKYFISISSPFRLFKNNKFLELFDNLDTKIKQDFTPGLIAYLAKKISEDSWDYLRNQSLEVLIENIGSPKF